MSFESQYASLIWDDLYPAYVPDLMTLNKDYVRIYGIPSSGNKDVDAMMAANNSYVKIPIIKILEYYDNGVLVQLPNRTDMITIHKNIEKYLAEWKEHIKYDININRNEHKNLLVGLEKLSKLIFDKAEAREIMDTILKPKFFGLVVPVSTKEVKAKEQIKPDYEGIGSLLRTNNRKGRF